MSSNEAETTESFVLPEDCEDDIDRLKDKVRGRAERCQIPSAGSIFDFPSVYGCDDLAAHTISNASKVGCSYWRTQKEALLTMNRSVLQIWIRS